MCSSQSSSPLQPLQRIRDAREMAWGIKLSGKVVNNNDQKLDFYIKPLSDEAAFNKGVEYFVEVVFFYGILIGIAVYEIVRS